MGALKAIQFKNAKTQTRPVTINPETPCCDDCAHQDHLINERWNYWVKDFETYGAKNSQKPYQSRETYKRLNINPPNQDYKKKMAKFDLTPKSPKTTAGPSHASPKAGPSKERTHRPIPKRIRPPKQIPLEPTIVVDRSNPPSAVQRPKEFLLDQQTYNNICSRIPTRPVLTTPRRAIKLPAPRDGQWDYTTNTL